MSETSDTSESLTSTAISKPSNPEILKRELKKLLETDILSPDVPDGSTGFLKSIDEAHVILMFLRDAEAKKMPESNEPPPPPKVQVPEEFICSLSNEIMIDPVTIASGQTFEKRYITEWLMTNETCPKTKQVLPHFLLKPNHSVDEVITRWCKDNNYDRRKPSYETVTELSHDGIQLLLGLLQSPLDRTEAANKLRRQTKKFPKVREFFLKQMPDSVSRLLNPLYALGDAVTSHLELQEHIIAALFNISVLWKKSEATAQISFVIPLLAESLMQGTVETRRNSAATLVSLLSNDSTKKLIADVQVLRALAFVISQDDLVASLKATSVFVYLCAVPENLENANPEAVVLENTEKAVSAGVIPVLVDKIKSGSYADNFLRALVVFSRQECAAEVMEEDTGLINHLFTILRIQSCAESCKYAVVIVSNMCSLVTPHSNRGRTILPAVDEEESQYGTFRKLTKQESDVVVTSAENILQCLRRLKTGEEVPQME